jgi:hypothetical protein
MTNMDDEDSQALLPDNLKWPTNPLLTLTRPSLGLT